METDGGNRQYLRWKPAYLNEGESGQNGQSPPPEIGMENAASWDGSRGFKGREDVVERDGDIGCCGCILMFFSVLLVICLFPFSLCMSIKVVAEYERAVIFRLGRVLAGEAKGPGKYEKAMIFRLGRVLAGEAKGPGLIFVFPCAEDMRKVDLRTIAYDVPPQEILTRDSVTVSVNAIVYYRIADPVASVCNVDNVFRSAQLLSATSLRNVLGTKLMAEVLTERDNIAVAMQHLLDRATEPWGIKVERVEIKDVRLPFQLQRAMAAEAEAAREAKAKVVSAEGEQIAARALKEAGDVMMESPAALQLRYLQTLGIVAAEKESTLLFPLPIDMMTTFMPSNGKYSYPKSKSTKHTEKSSTTKVESKATEMTETKDESTFQSFMERDMEVWQREEKVDSPHIKDKYDENYFAETVQRDSGVIEYHKESEQLSAGTDFTVHGFRGDLETNGEDLQTDVVSASQIDTMGVLNEGYVADTWDREAEKEKGDSVHYARESDRQSLSETGFVQTERASVTEDRTRDLSDTRHHYDSQVIDTPVVQTFDSNTTRVQRSSYTVSSFASTQTREEPKVAVVQPSSRQRMPVEVITVRKPEDKPAIQITSMKETSRREDNPPREGVQRGRYSTKIQIGTPPS